MRKVHSGCKDTIIYGIHKKVFKYVTVTCHPSLMFRFSFPLHGVYSYFSGFARINPAVRIYLSSPRTIKASLILNLQTSDF